MKRFAFPRQARIVHERDFRRIYRDGKRFLASPLRFCVLRREDEESRLGLAVSRKVGNAVVRNRWKRAVREAFRLNRHRLAAPHDVVVSVGWDASRADVARVADAFEALIAWLNAGAKEASGR
jgi:ribonuclease P protein component